MILDDKIKEIRKDFPYLDSEKVGKKIIYFDNAATTQKPRQVVEAMDNYYYYQNANPHRGAHYLTVKATQVYEDARKKVSDFINSSTPNQVIFTRNTTEGLNLVARSYALANLKKGDEIITTILDHHSNFVTWQFVAEKTGADLKVVHLNDDFGINMEEYKNALTDKTKLVCFTGASNVTSYVTDYEKMVQMAKEVGAVTVLDAAQVVPHFKIDVESIGCDFMAFSGHKMLAPMGIGVLYGKEDLLNSMDPFLFGGEMIEYVYEDRSTYAKSPARFEAGTMDVGAAAGLAAAIDYLEGIGMDKIHQREIELADLAYQGMKERDYIEMYYPREKSKRGPNIAFNFKDIHPHDVASVLDHYGIAVRSGHHCAMPLHAYLDINASCRASFAFYNTAEEVEEFLGKLEEVRKVLGRGN